MAANIRNKKAAKKSDRIKRDSYFSVHYKQAKTSFMNLWSRPLGPEEILSLDVDVLAPCALGAAINDLSLPEIKAKVIAGAANNQLAREDIGELLQQRGILYAPDYVINAGGVIDIFHQRMESSSNEALRAHIEQIGETLKEIYTRAEQEGAATNRVANLIAEERFSLKG